MSLIDDFFNERNAARQTAVANIEANPDDAARAVQLSTVAGFPPEVVSGDLPTFERNSRSNLASDIINNNSYLSEYINTHPIAAQISNDDYGTLDNVTQRLQPFLGISASIGRGGLSIDIGGRFGEALKRGFGEQGYLEWAARTDTDRAILDQMRREPGWQPFLASAVAVEAFFRSFGAALHGFHETGSTALTPVMAQFVQPGRDPRTASEQLMRDVTGIAEYLMNYPGHTIGTRSTNVPLRRQIEDVLQQSRPFLEAGREPPPRVNPLMDELKAEQARVDSEALRELQREAQQSATRERSPEMFANFVRMQQPGDIFVPFEAIARLYGEKVPEVGDNLLGWVPDMWRQWNIALATGGDIRIPMAEWLARVEPTVASELRNDIRVRRDGVTIEEAKVLKEQATALAEIEAFHGSPHSFEAFSMEKIGTGEGAQSYGHGLYFAENRAVAESYQKMAQRKADWTSTEPEQMPPGQMYRVRIRAEPEQFLDWDRPLSEQPSIAQRMGERFPFEGGTETGEGLYRYMSGRGPEAASKALLEAGIPGIRYLDQGSRGLVTGARMDIPIARAQIETLRATVEQSKKHLQQLEEAGTKDGPVVQKLHENIASNELLIRKAEERIAQAEKEQYQGSYNYVLFDDSLIEILDRNGQAIEGVRRQAGLTPLTEIGAVKEAQARKGEARVYAGTEEAFVPERLTPAENQILKAFDETLDKYISDVVKTQPVTSLKSQGRPVRGTFISYTDRAPIILFALKGGDIVGTARHEAIHALRNLGFFTEAEWATLREAALKERWFEKQREGKGSSILERYARLFDEGDTARLADLDIRRDRGPEYQRLKKKQDEALDRFLEEAVADEFKYWNHTAENPTIASAVFKKLREFLERLKEVFISLRSRDPEVARIFEAIESGEIGRREPTSVTEAMTAAEREKQLELDVTRQQDKAIFDRASAIGMTVDQYRRYIKKIAERDAEDTQAQRDRAQAIEKRRQTAEWRQESTAMIPEVTADLASRPDIAAVRYFRYGELYGEKLGERPRIDPQFLTEAQRKAIPEQWLKEDGARPDDVAGLFGFQTAGEMILRIAEFEQARGNRRPGDFFDSLVATEVERRMVAKYGELDKNILSAAEDHVLSVTQMDLLHEETVALGMRNNLEITLTKDQIKASVLAQLERYPAKMIDTAHFLNVAGKAGKAAEMALLKDDFAEAFKAKQQQYYAILAAREAKRFEKEQVVFERIVDRFSKREVNGIDQEFVDAIQALLNQAGLPMRRSLQEAMDGLERVGFRSVDDFVTARRADGYELEMVDWIANGELRQRAANLTVEEARDLHVAIKTLVHAGREAEQVNISGEKARFDTIKSEIMAHIRERPLRDPAKQSNMFYKIDSSLRRMEEIVKDLDMREELGPMYRAVIEPMVDAKHTEFSMFEDLVKKLKAIRSDTGRRWRRSLDDAIPQDFLLDPYYAVPVPFDLTRGQMINIMLNFGTRSNIDKFTIGYFGRDGAARGEAQLRALFDQHATRKDWDYVQSIWNIFKDWQGPAAEMYYRLSGVPPKMLEALEVQTPHGNYAGGYFPIFRDPNRNFHIRQTEKGMFGGDHVRSTTANGYTMERTNAVVRVLFDNTVDQIGHKMQQMIHDISYREALMQAKKVMKDKDIFLAIKKHYGDEYANQIDPWLDRIASQFNIDERANDFWYGASRRFRMNLITHALGFSAKVFLSPDIGLFNPKIFAQYTGDYIAKILPNALVEGGQWDKIATEKSKEIQHTFRNMDRDYRESLDRVILQNGWNSFQASAVRAGFAPIVWLSQRFRIMTFVDNYHKALERGLSEGEAISFADSLVRERHGASGIADLPAAMAGTEFMKQMTVFQGYFNTQYNWAAQAPGQLRQRDFGGFMKTVYGSVLIGAFFNYMIFNRPRERESLWEQLTKAVAGQFAGMIPLINQGYAALVEGFRPVAPWGAFIQALSSSRTDIVKAVQQKRIDKGIQHTANVIGMGLGLPLAQIGRTGQFVYDVNRGKQRPRNIIEWGRGIIHGEARLKR